MKSQKELNDIWDNIPKNPDFELICDLQKLFDERRACTLALSKESANRIMEINNEITKRVKMIKL